MTALNPAVVWSEDPDKLFITFDVQDCAKPDIKISNAEGAGEITFKGANSAGQVYSCDLKLAGAVKEDGNKISRTDRHIVLVVNKEEEKRWGKLVAGKAPTFVKVDWDKWVDSDDEDAGPPGGFGGFDMSQFDNFQNWDDEGDSGAMAEDSDDDDEDLPDLEK